jgi:hypothetical protein
MDMPYKLELGEHYLTELYGKVLAESAICHYNTGGFSTVRYHCKTVDGYYITVEENKLIKQTQTDESPNQGRINDLVEQVKVVLEQAGIMWERHLHLCVNCGMDVEFEQRGIAYTYLVDLQRALRAYLGEEKP